MVRLSLSAFQRVLGAFSAFLPRANRPRSICQCSNMASRLSGQISIFGNIFFVSKSLLGIERREKVKKIHIFYPLEY